MAVAGKRYPPVEMTLDPEHVRAFALAIGVDPEAGVPPTYAAVYALGPTFPQLVGDPEAAVDYGHLVHGEQEFAWDRHPEPGQTLTAVATVTDDSQRRNLRFLTYETEVTEAGKPICTSRMLSVIRS